MKKSAIVSLLVLFIFLIPSSLLNAQELPEVIALRELELRPDANEIHFQNYYNKWCKNIKTNTKGVNAWLMKGDRGARIGKYNMAWGFNYIETRDYYFPVSDITNYPKWNAALERFRFQAPEEPLVENMTEYTDFIVIGYDKMLNPQLGEVISISYPTVKAGMENELENFVTQQLNNACQDNIKGFYMYLLKGNRGAQKGTYAVLRVFDTYEDRKHYFPENSAIPSQNFIKARKKIMAPMEKFKTFFENPPVENSSDYVIVY